MNKRLIIIGFAILTAAIFVKLIFVILSNIKVDDFHKTAVTFIIESSKNNSAKLPSEIKYIKSLCAILDPEDAVKIIKTGQSAYLIYEGGAGEGSNITAALQKYTNDQTTETTFGEAIKKAVDYSLTMKKEGYNTSIVILGTLEEQGSSSKQINWDTLPDNIKKTKQYLPELAIMFVYADPEKLDFVKTKLNPILGENKLIIANEANIDKVNYRFLKAIGR